MSIHPLLTYLEPIADFLQDSQITEVVINDPERINLYQRGNWIAHPMPHFTLYWLEGLGRLIANYSGQVLESEHPFLSAMLPGNIRVQVVFPPACDPSQRIFAFRRGNRQQWTLLECQARGLFEYCPEAFALLTTTVEKRDNVLMIGATNTGKTTLLNACLEAIPLQERVITLEDVREIHLSHGNKVHLLGGEKVEFKQLVHLCLRLTPDRVIFGEIRGAEAACYWQLLMAGHRGMIATLHAADVQTALARLSYLASLEHGSLNQEMLQTHFSRLIHWIVVLSTSSAGQRRVTSIERLAPQ